MNVRQYLRDNREWVLFHLAGMLVLSAFLLLTGTSGSIVILILCVWVPVFALVMGVAYYRQTKKLEELWAILDALPEKHLFMECVPPPYTGYEKEWQQMMRKAGKSMIEEVSSARRQQKEYREYIENWVHEIKVPITTMQLVCENNRSQVNSKILLELAKVEQQVERALYYARSTQIEKDFVVRRTQLSDVVNAAVVKHRTLLIQNGVRVEAELPELYVFTDDKWLAFIIGQLFSNAVKYKREQPVITVAAAVENGGIALSIMDNGIGISAAELPRVFEKGFTGSNGRSRGGATGMGLYLCKKLATHLDIDISAEAVEGEYTCIRLWFPDAAGALQANLSKL